MASLPHIPKPHEKPSDDQCNHGNSSERVERGNDGCNHKTHLNERARESQRNSRAYVVCQFFAYGSHRMHGSRMTTKKAHQFFSDLHDLVCEYGAGKTNPSALLGPLCQIIAYVAMNGSVTEASIVRVIASQFIKEERRRSGYVATAGRKKLA